MAPVDAPSLCRLRGWYQNRGLKQLKLTKMMRITGISDDFRWFKQDLCGDLVIWCINWCKLWGSHGIPLQRPPDPTADSAEDRIGSLATRAMNWANLRRKSNAEPWADRKLGARYPLVMTNIAMERSTIFHGKIHYKWWFSIVMLNYQRVTWFSKFLASKIWGWTIEPCWTNPKYPEFRFHWRLYYKVTRKEEFIDITSKDVDRIINKRGWWGLTSNNMGAELVINRMYPSWSVSRTWVYQQFMTM